VVLGEFPKLSETFVIEQITGLLERGHDVRIFAFRRSGEALAQAAISRHALLERTSYLTPAGLREKLAGVPAALGFAVTHPRSLRYPRALALRAAHGARGSFDVIYCHFGHVADEARRLRAAGLFSGPLVAVFHGFDVSVWPGFKQGYTYAPLFREARRLLPISEYWRDRLVAMGAEPAKVEVLRMGVDCGALKFRTRSIAEAEPLQLVSIGRLVEKKGTAYAIRAIARAQRTLDRPLHYHIVGDGPLRDELVALARSENIERCVTFHGPRRFDEIVALLEGMHVLLAPSVTAANKDMEGIPMVLMEAMAQGLPVISTFHSGIPELVNHGETGYLVAERDSDALAAAIVSLARTPEDWPRLTRNARNEVERDFNAARLGEQLERVLLDASLKT